MASALKRILGKWVGRGYDQAKARKLFRDFVKASATIAMLNVVKPGRRARIPLLRRTRYEEMATPIPRLGSRIVRRLLLKCHTSRGSLLFRLVRNLHRRSVQGVGFSG